MPFPAFFLLAAALGGAEVFSGLGRRRERADTIEGQFGSTRGALEAVTNSGVLLPEQMVEAQIIQRRLDQAEANSKSKDKTLRSRGFAELDAARNSLRTLERSVPTAQRAAKQIEEQAGIFTSPSVDSTQLEDFRKRSGEIETFRSMAVRLNNQGFLSQSDQLKADLEDDIQTFRAQQASLAESKLREQRDNERTDRLNSATNAREFALADRANAIGFQKELSTDILNPLGDIQKFYSVIINATSAPNGVVDKADLTNAGIALNKLFNPQAEASDVAIRNATNNLATNIFGLELADIVDDVGGLIGSFGFSEVQPGRIEDIRRNATTVYNAAIEAAIRKGEDLRTRSGLTIQDAKHLQLVGLDRLDSLTVIEIPARQKAEQAKSAGLPTVLFPARRLSTFKEAIRE